MLNIVIFGAPGSGKGTQSERIVAKYGINHISTGSERIVAKYGINHISTGDVLRAEIKNGTELGKTAKGYIDQGQLLPDNLIIDILASTLDSFKDSKGVIFDGFPRTIAQAEALKKMLAERGQQVSVMLDLDVPEDELMKRLILRGQQSGRADDNDADSSRAVPTTTKRPSRSASPFTTARPLRSSTGTSRKASTPTSTDWASWRPSQLTSVRRLMQ